ncbi:GH116 family glycosyl-hydrolase [Paenibacillus sp. D2_2]|uniref:GH116 family glycosyl-hydrolase n=1 Tax=Paenibacillus sp. D2_2 TaxID=3073092 RepID=UPI0028158733|nr:GH116 family glycosyl-hydrolase [Paenibacillus sp. D2_2]WMT39752.1 GH116 family glycosyl-hydrolase [Paenibacillus sp. D2_2]
MKHYSYLEEELLERKKQRTYPGQATQAKFLLGGIGTGNVSVGSRGQLCDWEIFNSQGKGNKLPYTFFAIRAQAPGEPYVAKVLESKLEGSFAGPCGFYSPEIAGLPRFAESELCGEYPFVSVTLKDSGVPVEVTLEAFTPFIPLNADDSGIPGAVLRYRVRNKASSAVDVTIAGSIANVVGLEKIDNTGYVRVKEQVRNRYLEQPELRGLFFDSPQLESDHLHFGSMALLTTDLNVTVKEEWLDGYWNDSIHDFWDDFCTDGHLEMHSEAEGIRGSSSQKDKLRIGSIGIHHVLNPGEDKVFEFVLAWHFPNRPKGWVGGITIPDQDGHGIVKNYYATLFKDAWHAGSYLLTELPRREAIARLSPCNVRQYVAFLCD